MNLPLKIIFLLLTILLSGCFSNTSKEIVDESSFTENEIINVPIEGGLIVRKVNGTMIVEQKWVGLLNSEDGWNAGSFAYGSCSMLSMESSSSRYQATFTSVYGFEFSNGFGLPSNFLRGL